MVKVGLEKATRVVAAIRTYDLFIENVLPRECCFEGNDQ